MSKMQASSVRNNFADAMNRVAYRGERIVLERRGKPLAALVPIEDLQRLEALEDQADYERAIRIEREAKERGEQPIPLDEVKKR